MGILIAVKWTVKCIRLASVSNWSAIKSFIFSRRKTAYKRYPISAARHLFGHPVKAQPQTRNEQILRGKN